jgi:hypothetical protein
MTQEIHVLILTVYFQLQLRDCIVLYFWRNLNGDDPFNTFLQEQTYPKTLPKKI